MTLDLERLGSLIRRVLSNLELRLNSDSLGFLAPFLAQSIWGLLQMTLRLLVLSVSVLYSPQPQLSNLSLRLMAMWP